MELSNCEKKKTKKIVTEDEQEHDACKKFRDALMNHSGKCKTYAKCHKQWEYSYFTIFEDNEQHKCICGMAIKKAHILVNIKTGKTVNVGFICYPNWVVDVTREDELQRIKSIKKLCAAKWNKFTKLFYSHYVGDISEWDCSFYKDIKDNRRANREKQW